MIKNLPLLPSSWGEWNWSQSNGNATTTQTNAGYQALLYQGQCSSFSRLIWNDLVDCTAAVISEAGLEWDPTYCSASDCKITARLGSLTATIFNSVALNIHRFGFVAWKWVMLKEKEGYVGRDAFYGYSTHEANADFLYGWYIIELTNKLNRVIQVLKEEADFGEFQSALQANAFVNSPLVKAKAGALAYNDTSVTYTPVLLTKAGALPCSVAISEYTYQDGLLLSSPSARLFKRIKSYSKVSAKSNGMRTGVVSYADSAETFSNTTLLPLVFVGYMRHNAHIKTNVIAPLDISNIKNMVTALVERTHDLSNLTKALPFPISTTVSDSSSGWGSMVCVERLPLQAAPYGESHMVIEPIKLPPFPIMSRSKEYSRAEGILHHIRPFYVWRNIQAFGYFNGNANVLDSSPALSINQGLSHATSNAISREIKKLSYTDISETNIDASAQCFRPMYVASERNSITHVDSALKEILGFKMSGDEKAKSKTDALILKGVPLLTEAAVEDSSYGTGVVYLPNVRRLSKMLKSYSRDRGVLSLARGNTESIVTTSSRFFAILENYTEETDWLNPIRENNNLYIRQVYDPWDKNDTLYLDAELWIPVVRIGDNLYIRQVYDAQKEDNVLYLDVELWSSPVRSGDDLHIRQVCDPWRKDSVIYLDAELWLSPVRTGDNLYIRSAESIDGGGLDG